MPKMDAKTWHASKNAITTQSKNDVLIWHNLPRILRTSSKEQCYVHEGGVRKLAWPGCYDATSATAPTAIGTVCL